MIFCIFMGRSRYQVLQHCVGVKCDPRMTAAYVPSHFMVLNPIFCYVSPKIVIFHEPLIKETCNKCHWIWHASFSIVTLQLTVCMQLKHSFLLSSFSIVITLQLTIFMQLKCSFSFIVIFNCCHFATDHLLEYVQFTIFHQ